MVSVLHWKFQNSVVFIFKADNTDKKNQSLKNLEASKFSPAQSKTSERKGIFTPFTPLREIILYKRQTIQKRRYLTLHHTEFAILKLLFELRTVTSTTLYGQVVFENTLFFSPLWQVAIAEGKPGGRGLIAYNREIKFTSKWQVLAVLALVISVTPSSLSPNHCIPWAMERSARELAWPIL